MALGSSFCFFADDVVLFTSSGDDLQLRVEQFAAEGEKAGMRIATLKSEAVVLIKKRVVSALRLREV